MGNLLVNILRKTNKHLRTAKQAEFNVDIDKQLTELNGYKEPQNDIERSFFQYRCQCFLRGNVISGMINILSFPVILLQLFSLRGDKIVAKSKADAVFLYDGLDTNILPEELVNKYKKIVYISEYAPFINAADIKFLKNCIRRYGWYGEFILKVLIKIARLRCVIEKYGPEAIIVCSEYSFTSSLLRQYCEENGIKLINVMHGDKLLCIQDAFFHFDQCYVWDKHYADLFTRLRAYAEQFIVAVPPALIYKGDPRIVTEREYTYYLGSESPKELKAIMQSLDRLTLKGNRVAIRPHPRYSDWDLVSKLANQFNLLVEDPRSIPIEQSLCKTTAVISQFSSVLLQAYFQEKRYIVDDITNEKKFKKLKELEYLILNTNYETLSGILENDK